ncbi:MAG: ArsA family ATPase [Limnoraphis sp. WC205]|jgi:anion-transporting  ArsA/GET3 family ATPase|nr:ArsA family ATPase [Limnoraphis sp. WC205]
MALILTFLGKGGTGRTTMAVATAKRLAQQGKRVLLATQDNSPALSLLLGETVGSQPTEVAPSLKATYLKSAELLEQSWEELKTLEAQYLRTPFFKNVYGQELGVLPGMDSALALNALRQYEGSGKYDAIIYDGVASQETLRMLGMPEVLSWYVRRFRQVFVESDFWKAVSPAAQLASSAVLSVDLSANNFDQPTNQVNNILEEGKAAVADPNRVVAYLVTTSDPIAIATARYLWGSAQQVCLTVGGVILNQANLTDEITQAFDPLKVDSVPQLSSQNWQPLMSALPDFSQASSAPRSITIDVAKRQVSLFFPGFDKKQIKLTQYGPEVTIEAGDQRRNIFLPDPLRGKPVTGAKFQNNYLIISF